MVVFVERRAAWAGCNRTSVAGKKEPSASREETHVKGNAVIACTFKGLITIEGMLDYTQNRKMKCGDADAR